MFIDNPVGLQDVSVLQVMSTQYRGRLIADSESDHYPCCALLDMHMRRGVFPGRTVYPDAKGPDAENDRHLEVNPTLGLLRWVIWNGGSCLDPYRERGATGGICSTNSLQAAPLFRIFGPMSDPWSTVSRPSIRVTTVSQGIATVAASRTMCRAVFIRAGMSAHSPASPRAPPRFPETPIASVPSPIGTFMFDEPVLDSVGV